MTGSFSTPFSAAGAAPAFVPEPCALALTAARAGSSNPKSLRENFFIDSLLTTPCCRFQTLYTPWIRGATHVPSLPHQPFHIFQIQVAIWSPQGFMRLGTAFRELHVTTRGAVIARPLRQPRSV